MELRQLQYFVTVAEEMSFTRASRRLHVVQSGVSSAIKNLERELGAALFDRDRHRVALTDAGNALLPEARAALAAAQAAQDAVAETRAALRGTLIIGTMLSTGHIDLPAVLGRFHAAHPGVMVRQRLAPGGSTELARHVIGGLLDLAVLSIPGQPPAGLTMRLLAEEPLLLVCHPEHRLAGRSPVTLDQLAAEPFIDFPSGWGNRAIVDRAFAAAGIDRQVPFEVAQFASAAGLVRHRLGVAFLPASAATEFPDLSRCEVSPGPVTWRVYVATATGRRLSAAAHAFRTELLAERRTARAAAARDTAASA